MARHASAVSCLTGLDQTPSLSGQCFGSFKRSPRFTREGHNLSLCIPRINIWCSYMTIWTNEFFDTVWPCIPFGTLALHSFLDGVCFNNAVFTKPDPLILFALNHLSRFPIMWWLRINQSCYKKICLTFLLFFFFVSKCEIGLEMFKVSLLACSPHWNYLGVSPTWISW